MSAPCACQTERLRRAHATSPAATGRLAVDRDALRRALGAEEVVEAMEAKAKGRVGVNAGRLWAFLSRSLYQSGDFPVLATREAVQNSVDSIRAAVRARTLKAGTGRFEATWDADRRALTFADNGVGMDVDTILGKFLSLGDTGKADAADSGQAAGGFGVAKAVILGTSSTFRWELHTRDNLAVSRGADHEIEVFAAPFLQGFRLTLFDVSKDFDAVWDRARQAWVPLLDRLREVVGANDLPDVELVLDGQPVPPLFSRRGGSKVVVDSSWGRGTTATVKAYRRPPGDRQGAYYLRLGGLYQTKIPSQRGNLRADVVVDLVTTVRPGQSGYPFNAGRDALQDSARWAFADLVDEVERENQSAGRSMEDEVFDPESDDADARRGAEEIGDLTAEAFADEDFRKVLADAAGGIADFYAERQKYAAKEEPAASSAPAGTKADDEDGPTRTVVLPVGFVPAVATAGGVLVVDAGAAPVEQIRRALEAADEARASAGTGAPVLTPAVRDVLDRAEAGQALDERDAEVVAAAIDRAAEIALGPGGGGLLQAAAVSAAAGSALDAVTRPAARVNRNPFGRLAGLRISKKRYDRKRAYRFRKNYGRWIPHLTVWDATLRLVAGEARIRRRFKPGFVLDDELLGLTTSSPGGTAVVYIHPDRLEQVIRAHRKRPLAIAAYLHGVACHELTHLDGRMGDGHTEDYIVAREDLGAATGHLLPAIAVLVTRVLGLPLADRADRRRKNDTPEVEIYRTAWRLRNRLPARLADGDLDGFIERNWTTLVSIVATSERPKRNTE